MSHSIHNIYLHLIFGTKERDPCLGPVIRKRLHSYLAEISSNLGYKTILFNGWVDHVHGLVLMGKDVLPRDWIRDLKANSSRFLKRECGLPGGFAWQGGYALFSVSPGGVDACRQYIHNQVEHHRTKTYQEELEEFLGRYKVDVDREYLWTD